MLEHQKKLAPEEKACEWIFCDSLGKPLRRSNFRKRSFLKLLKASGLPKIRFHDLRHSAATLLLSKGVHPKIVQERLGHSQISVTLDTYSHVLPSLQKDAVQKITDLLPGSDAPTIMPLAGEDDLVAIQAVCTEKVFWDKNPDAKRLFLL